MFCVCVLRCGMQFQSDHDMPSCHHGDPPLLPSVPGDSPGEIPGDGTDLEDPGSKNLGTVSVHLPRIYTHIYIHIIIYIYIYIYIHIYIFIHGHNTQETNMTKLPTGRQIQTQCG